MSGLSALQHMKLAQEELGYEKDPNAEAVAKKRKALALVALGLVGGGYLGHRIGKSRGQKSVLKDLSDDENLAHFATRGGTRSFQAYPGYGVSVDKKIKFST